MLKKTITYESPDGEEVTEDFYFHISKAELIKMQFLYEGGFQAYLQRIGNSKDPKTIIEAFEDITRKSYGVRTADGKFLKDSQKTEEFLSSEAYSEFFMEIATDPTAASTFINGIMPKGLEESVEKMSARIEAAEAAGKVPAETPALAKASTALATEEDPTGLTNSVTPQVLTPADIAEMDADELKSGLATGRYKLS